MIAEMTRVERELALLLLALLGIAGLALAIAGTGDPLAFHGWLVVFAALAGVLAVGAVDCRRRHVGIVADRGRKSPAAAARGRPSAGAAGCASGAAFAGGGGGMIDFLYLAPIAIALGLTGLAAFLWSLHSDQYEDMDGADE